MNPSEEYLHQGVVGGEKPMKASQTPMILCFFLLASVGSTRVFAQPAPNDLPPEGLPRQRRLSRSKIRPSRGRTEARGDTRGRRIHSGGGDVRFRLRESAREAEMFGSDSEESAREEDMFGSDSSGERSSLYKEAFGASGRR